jgi:transcriptional regulator with XRE-family HTH domain
MQINNLKELTTIKLVDNIGLNNINYSLFREARLSKNYSLRFIAKSVGKGVSAIAKYERGACLPRSWFILKALCMELSLSPDVLLGINDSPQDPHINIELLKKYRETYNNISARKLSTKLQLCPTTEKNYEHHSTVPHAWLFLKLFCVTLGISANDILGISVIITEERNTELFDVIYNYLDL